MSRHLIYNRQLLLHGAKRNSVLELWEVERYGTDSYGDADYVSVYGLRPREWYASELRIYELNVPGQNHGVLLGTKGWVPN